MSPSGRGAEDAAAVLLESKGLTVVERNFRTPMGEIDLIARDGDSVVFVEVRSRASLDFGGAAASVTPAKVRRVVKAAQAWLSARGWEGACRFDVVAVEGGELEHIEDAFDAGEAS